jgi:hypothetical protein
MPTFLPKEMSSTWYKVKEFTEKEEEKEITVILYKLKSFHINVPDM